MTTQQTSSEDRSYRFDGGRTGALLLHGLGGTPVEMRYVALALARAGITVSCPQLAGHNGSFEELQASSWYDWYVSAESPSTSCASAATASSSAGCRWVRCWR